jgi:hypothetical protein
VYPLDDKRGKLKKTRKRGEGEALPSENGILEDRSSPLLPDRVGLERVKLHDGRDVLRAQGEASVEVRREESVGLGGEVCAVGGDGERLAGETKAVSGVGSGKGVFLISVTQTGEKEGGVRKEEGSR